MKRKGERYKKWEKIVKRNGGGKGSGRQKEEEKGARAGIIGTLVAEEVTVVGTT